MRLHELLYQKLVVIYMDKESEIPALRAVHFRETMTTDATCKPITVNINVKESRKVVLNVNPQRKTIPNSQLRLF
jgi:hypothetical protein